MHLCNPVSARCRVLIGLFPQKSPMAIGSFAERDLQLKKMHASSQPHICKMTFENCYGVATVSRLLKSIGLFCKRALEKRSVFCKETCSFKEPTNRSHAI